MCYNILLSLVFASAALLCFAHLAGTTFLMMGGKVICCAGLFLVFLVFYVICGAYQAPFLINFYFCFYLWFFFIDAVDCVVLMFFLETLLVGFFSFFFF